MIHTYIALGGGAAAGRPEDEDEEDEEDDDERDREWEMRRWGAPDILARDRERSRERSRERERVQRRELDREQEEVDLHVQGLRHYLRMFSTHSRALQERRGRMEAREEERRREREEDRWRRDFSPGWWRSAEERERETCWNLAEQERREMARHWRGGWGGGIGGGRRWR